MPIDPELRRRCYNTKAWRDQRMRIINGRAQRQCECTGQCGRPSRCRPRCVERHEAPGEWMNGHIWLQLVHVDRSKTGQLVDDDSVRAFCAGCHLRYDQVDHITAAKRRRWREEDARARAAGQLDLLHDDDEA